MADESIVGMGQTVDAVKLEARLTRLDVAQEQANYMLKDMSKVLRAMQDTNRERNGRLERMETSVATHHLDHVDTNLVRRVGDLELRHQIGDGIQRLGWKLLLGGVTLIAGASSAGGALVALFAGR